MTRYTRVMFSQCWLAPVKVWEEFDQIKDLWKYSQHNWHGCVGRIRSITHYYTGKKNYVLDNFAKYLDMNFTGITRRPRSSEHLKPFHSNHQYMPQQFKDGISEYWVGSSGHFYLTLKKKLGFWRHRTDRRRGWWRMSLIICIKYLYDKYKSHEDTRSTDQ